MPAMITVIAVKIEPSRTWPAPTWLVVARATIDAFLQHAPTRWQGIGSGSRSFLQRILSTASKAKMLMRHSSRLCSGLR